MMQTIVPKAARRQAIGRWRVAVACAAALCVAGPRVPAAGSGAEVLGFISSVSGKASLTRGGKTTTLEGMEAVRAGDVVKAEKDAAVSVNLCGLGKKIDMKGKASAAVGKTGLKFSTGAASGKKNIDAAFCSVLMESSGKYDRKPGLKKDDIAEAVGAMGMMEIFGTSGSGSSAMKNVLSEYDASSGLGGLGISGSGAAFDSAGGGADKWEGVQYDAAMGGGGGSTVYKEEKIYKPDVVYVMGKEAMTEDLEVSGRPAFAWVGAYGAMGFQVRIVNSVNATVYEARAARPLLVFPHDAPPLLNGGWYLCQVDAEFTEGILEPWLDFGLSVWDSERQERFDAEESDLEKALGAEKDTAQGQILLGRFYETAGVPALAVLAYEKALAKAPRNEGLKERLGTLARELRWDDY